MGKNGERVGSMLSPLRKHMRNAQGLMGMGEVG
jgi:hypothetical protein